MKKTFVSQGNWAGDAIFRKTVVACVVKVSPEMTATGDKSTQTEGWCLYVEIKQGR